MKKIIIALFFLGFIASISSCASRRPGCPGMADNYRFSGKQNAIWK